MWNTKKKKKHNIIISRIISSHLSPINIVTPCIISNSVISSHIGPMYI